MVLAEMFDVQGKVALVTGGSAGIGLMIAGALVRAGCRVYISSRKEEACREAAAKLNCGGPHGTCEALPADLSNLGQIAELAQAIRDREPTLHLLFNNAGATWGAPIAEVTASSWDKVLDLNLKSPFFLVQSLLPLLEAAATAKDPSRIINIGSIDGIRTSVFEAYAYGASKAAIHHLTRTLAARLAQHNITVNAIAPGYFVSRMTAPMVEQTGKEMERSVPLGRIGGHDDIAGAVIFLASRASAYMTGAVIPIDGGILIRS